MLIGIARLRVSPPPASMLSYALPRGGSEMRSHFSFVLAVVAALTGAGVAAQTTRAPDRWSPPRTPDGQPDLQGIWTNATITPFERPAGLRDKVFLTEAEAAALEQQTASQRAEEAPPRA